MAKEEAIELEGVVVEAHRGGKFLVKLETGGVQVDVLATLGGKLKVNNIKVVPGDKVKVDVSPYDLTRGRITFRIKD